MKFEIEINKLVTIQKQNEAEEWWPPKPASVGDYLVFASLLFAVITYIINQKLNRQQNTEENKWKRIEFIFDQLDKFDHDKNIMAALSVLNGQNREEILSRLFGEDGKFDVSSLHPNDVKTRSNMDVMFSFLEQIAYAKNNSTISQNDLNLFEWHFYEIVAHEGMKKYVKRYYPTAFATGFNIQKVVNERKIELDSGSDAEGAGSSP